MGVTIGGLDLGFDLPTWGLSGVWWWIVVILLIILMSAVVGVALWIYYQWKIYNKKIILFENIAGQGYQVVGRDKARIVKIGDGGEEILFLRRRKVYRTAYGRKMGANTYWFAIGQDGYWYNIVLGDLDAKMGMLDIEPIDRDMRYMHVAIRKNIQDRYKKESFMQKYGVMVISGVFLLVMLIAIWLLMSKAGDLIQASERTVQTIPQLAEHVETIVSKLDTVYSGSGIRPA